MTTLQHEIEHQKQLAARTSRRIRELRSGHGFTVRVESGHEKGYAFTKVALAKGPQAGALVKVKRVKK